MPLCVALVHHPVTNKHGATVTASITNFDIHDIARSCCTFGADRYFLVTPSEPQQWLARRIVNHWREGWGADYNPNRREALDLIEVVPDLDAVLARVREQWGGTPRLVGTSARGSRETLSMQGLRAMLENPDEAVCLLFGTGWGLHSTLMERVDFLLEPIEGVGDYNHLSVRAAVAIVLDRLHGRGALPC